jgi:hypothetical protein
MVTLERLHSLWPIPQNPLPSKANCDQFAGECATTTLYLYNDLVTNRKPLPDISRRPRNNLYDAIQASILIIVDCLRGCICVRPGGTGLGWNEPRGIFWDGCIDGETEVSGPQPNAAVRVADRGGRGTSGVALAGASGRTALGFPGPPARPERWLSPVGRVSWKSRWLTSIRGVYNWATASSVQMDRPSTIGLSRFVDVERGPAGALTGNWQLATLGNHGLRL